jgi:hypothetical protein
MGAVPNPLLITAGGRLMILEQVRFGVSSLTVNKKKLFESDYHQNLYLKLQGFAAFSCASY